MARMRLTGCFGALLLVVGLAAGCGDDPAAGNGNSDTGPDTGPDATPDGTPDVDPGDHNRLVLVTEPEPSVSFSERVAMQVRYVDSDDLPIADTFIQFAVQGDTGDSRLSAQNALSNAEGVAETFIEAGGQQLDFDVIISVPSDDTVDPLTVRVRIQPKDASDYIIRVTYEGPVHLNRVEVLLYDTDRACNTLVEDPHTSPSNDVAWTSLIILPDAEGDIPERGLNVPRNTTFQYAVARGEPSDGSGGGRGYFVAFGCNDVIPGVEPGTATVIEIDMHNLWPDVAGTYRIQNEMDLLDIIPDSFQPIVESIGEFFDDPGLGLLRIAALAIGGEQYWNDSTFGLLFECSNEDPETGDCLGDVTPTTFGLAAAGIVEALVDIGIEALPGAAGDTIRDVLQAGSDVFENAQAFSMAGDFIVRNDPDTAGLLGDDNEVVFNRITWLWQGNDRTIDLREESFLRGQNIAAAVVFHPDQDPTVNYALKVDPFDLSLNYGEMLIWVLEGIVFPEFIGECNGNFVDSFEDLFSCLIDCEDIGDRVAAETTTGIGNAVEAACEQLQLTAVDALENWLASLTLDLGTYYHMGTPADNPCIANFAPSSTDFRIQSLGGSADTNHCQWAGEIRFDSGSEDSEVLDGEWWGERL